MKRLALTVVLVASAALLSAQDNPMRPGQWEVAMQMQMAGMSMPEMKTTHCITPEQLAKDPASGLPNGVQRGQDSCKVSDYKQTGNTVTWKMACSEPQPLTADGELTFAGDAYTGTITMMMPQGAMSMKMNGKRLGDCAN